MSETLKDQIICELPKDWRVTFFQDVAIAVHPTEGVRCCAITHLRPFESWCHVGLDGFPKADDPGLRLAPRGSEDER